ncbi:hypothetical protein H072_4499 [Dactylellina haptotyla CBS 200.50]|uniref:CBM1 domain-containing protein n=1 Tax=Dactylellina haptotyla (strain CBS 200.50) TaxID=1284197 RepID=S8BQ96_DACHA|nr:hypothetical protein H072_4499 [Dactylellina haptotyla CBS 200.50]
MIYRLATIALVAATVNAQQTVWGQCGGIGWTGPTTCVSGASCFAQNPYYSQCLPGTASSATTTTTTGRTTTTSTRSSTTSPRTSTTTIATRSSTTSSRTTTTSTTATRSTTTSTRTITTSSRTTTTTGVCGTATFSPISAQAAFDALQPGWNIGNTLDAIPNEGSWNNPPITSTVIDAIQASGYKSIRIPVTWTHHFTGSSPTKGLYAVLNVHHDSWEWFDVTQFDNAGVEERFGALWAQIGDRFKCKSQKLLFEPINEPPGTTAAHGTELNKLNDIFLTKINQAGGFNPQRVVTLSGLGMDSYKTISWFQRGSLYPNQPWGLQFHYYSPYDFIFRAWGKTTWGSDAEKASLETDFSTFRGNFTGIPVVIGEFGGSPAALEPAAAWRYFDWFTQMAVKYHFSIMAWDNGEDLFNRTSLQWYNPTGQSILMSGSKGVISTLPLATTDGAVPQLSSAFIFHKVGTPVTSQTASYELHGTLVSIKNKAVTTLTSSQYTFSSAGVLTLPVTYLSTLYSSSSAAGVKEELTLTFSQGAFLTLTIVQWTVPTVSQTTLADPTADYRIPITWGGYNRVAAVRAVWDTGAYVSDDWTVYLPTLQNARWTFGSWGYEASNIVLWQSGADYLRNNKPAGATTALLTWEFYPRDGYTAGSNAVNMTITF